MSESTQDSVALLKWDGTADRVLQDVEWTLDERDDSTNQLRVTTSLAEGRGIATDQQLVFQNRRFVVSEPVRTRADDRAVIVADEAQVELGGKVLKDFAFNSWTAQQALEWALKDTLWTPGEVHHVRFGRANFDDITVLEACHFLARHQDATLTFDSLRRRVNITAHRGRVIERVFTYGRELTNIEKTERAPVTTVIIPTGADEMTVASVNGGSDRVEDFGYYTSQGVSLAEARARFTKEDYWSDSRYEVAENMLRDAQARLAEEAYPQITYTLTAMPTAASDGTMVPLDLDDMSLGDKMYVWDEEIEAKLVAEVTALTTSSDRSANELTLAYLPESLSTSGGGSAGSRGQYQGDSGSTAEHPLFPKSGFQPRPSMPILVELSDLGVAIVRWNGQDHDGNYDTIPVRFGSVIPKAVRLNMDGSVPSPDSVDASEGAPIHSRGGGESTLALPGAGDYAIWFYMLGQDQNTTSEYSEALIVEVPELFDSARFRERLDDARTELENYVEQHGNREGTEPPTEAAHDGVVYYQRSSEGGPVVAVWQWRGGMWHEMPMTDAVLTQVTTDKLVAGESLIDGVLIKEGGITVEHLTALDSIASALGEFLVVRADMIEANAIDGMTIDGGVITGGRVEGSALIGGYLNIGPRYTDNGNRGIQLASNGVFRAYDSAGNLHTIIDGDNNRFTGRVATARPGSPGLVFEPASSNSNRPSIFFSPDGQASGDHPGVYTDNLWQLNLRGRRMSSGAARNRIIVDGGFYIREGRLTSDVDATFTQGIGVSGADSNFYENVLFHDWLHYPGAPDTDAPANVHIGGSGGGRGQYFWRTSSLRSIKANIEDLDYDEDTVLSLRPRSWIGKAAIINRMGEEALTETSDGLRVDEQAALDAGLTRTVGFVAEEVEALGLPGLATYDVDDETGEQTLNGVAYDRIAALLIPIIRRQRDQITSLEERLTILEEKLGGMDASH